MKSQEPTEGGRNIGRSEDKKKVERESKGEFISLMTASQEVLS